MGRAFNAMAADLASADLQRRQLVATVSHELRTPLTAQRALLENLVDGVVRPDDDALRAALTQSERLSALVGDLLDLSRIDAGAAPLALTEVRVGELLRAAVAEALVGGRPVRVRQETQPADLTVVADPARLAQLVANLVDNAVRHSPPQGEVRVVARAVDDDTWWLEVHDDGPGIPAERVERVFDRFGSGGDSAGGTGLGLAIASWVCELHGGTITALPTAPGTTGAHLRAVLPRRARAGRPTHLQEERTVSAPTTPTTRRPRRAAGPTRRPSRHRPPPLPPPPRRPGPQAPAPVAVRSTASGRSRACPPSRSPCWRRSASAPGRP